MQIKRHKTRGVKVGGIMIGNQTPVVIQSMTNTPTADINATVNQIEQLVNAGSELVRLTVNDDAAAKAIPVIDDQLAQKNISVPLVGDFHFNGHTLLNNHPECAQRLAKYRINPGNLGAGNKHDENFELFVKCAVNYDKPVRIGVNWGSIDKNLLSKRIEENESAPSPLPGEELLKKVMVESALTSARHAESLGLSADKIIISCKVSQVGDLVDIYQELARQSDYALHLGLTEAGMGAQGIVGSTSALAILLAQGIGDTIRVSLTPSPGQSRTQEVMVAQQILQSLGLRSFAPTITSCPGCGRTDSADYLELADEIRRFIDKNIPDWRERYPGVENLSLAVMGCVVNGPGESRHADIGISLPGKGESPVAPVYIDGEKHKTLKGPSIADEFKQIISAYVKARYGDKTH